MMTNRLANASSPYLRMHADNPVYWQPWDAAALEQARNADTPILLSIGYSACHWCHVMAHECFEKPDIAAAMNQSFVNIKLDREERPDIDHIYQLAHQALSGRGGGWPLTVFLDPRDLSPFYIGTYFPPTAQHGLPGFREVLQRVRAYYDSHRDELRGNAEALRDWFERVESIDADATLDAPAATARAWQNLSTHFDSESGGHPGAPKFPRAAELEWLLDQTDRVQAHDMAHLTLTTMAERGLQDHLGGGFFRYCVDARWTIPHFEKMLYDNVQLLPVYARVGMCTDAGADLREMAATAVHGIVTWLTRDMMAPDGAFYSAMDADSAGGEGSFYLWTREQMHAVLPEPLEDLAHHAFGLDHPPNFEGRAWHLQRTVALDDLVPRGDDVAAEYATLREQLFNAREQREPPARDDKILTAWNALTISGLARTARLREDARCADMARRALDALHESAWDDGELFANVAEPASRIPGFLDDYAFVLDALMETLQLTFDVADLGWAITLADTLCDRFVDHESGGFWFSTPQHETPLARGRTLIDAATPSGNSTAISALLRLGHLLGNTHYLDTAERALHAAAGALQHHPEACPSLLRALVEFEHPRTQIVVRSPPAAQADWQSAVQDALRHAGLVPGSDAVDAFFVPAESDSLPGLLSERTARGGMGAAWVCSGLTCQAPVTSPEALADVLHATPRADH